MDLRIGDRFADEEGTWEIATHPVVLRDGRTLEATIRQPDQPASEKTARWPAHERLVIRRPSAASPVRRARR